MPSRWLNRAAGWVLKRTGGLPEAWFDHAPTVAPPSDLTNPFAKSVWVMRAIKKIAAPISAVPLKFTLGEDEYQDPALAAFWRNPATGLRLPDFIEASVGWLKLKGEVFWLLDDSTLRPFPDVPRFSPLLLARPDRLREIVSDGRLAGWVFTDGSHRKINLLPEQVAQCKTWNPTNDFRGLAEYQAAQMAAEADYAAGAYARNLMANNGDTGPIISSKAGMLSDEQQRQIVSQLKAKQDYARRGEFRAAFLTSEVSVENATAQTTDANFSAMRLGNRHEIFIAFGVPPSMADVMVSYSVGSASDWYLLICETCIPTANLIAAQITKVAQRMTGKPVEAYFDFDDHPVMQAVRRERMDVGMKLWNVGMPMEDVSDYLDLGLPEFDGWDVGYLPFSVAPVAETEAPTAPTNQPPETSPAFGEEAEPEDEAVQAAITALRTRAHGEECACCDLHLGDLQIKATDTTDVRRWKSIVAKRRETIRAYQSKFSAVLMTARREVIHKLERAAVLDAVKAHQRAAAADFMFNLDDFRRLFQVSLRNVAATALQDAGNQVMAELKIDDPWKMPATETIQFLQERANKLSQVPDHIWERIKSRIDEGLTAGAPLREIAQNIRGEFNEIGEKRGMTIAKTETAAAYGAGRHSAMVAKGVQWKEWLTSNNGNVRAAHKLMNGVREAIGQPFTVYDPKTGNIDLVQHPAQGGGAPWNVINCHCVEVAVAEGPQGIAEPSA
jgi:hypothetical protein